MKMTKRHAACAIGIVALAYLAVVYLVVPLGWLRYEHRHPALDAIPDITYTADDIPGDPLNVALVGTKAELVKIMLASDWHPADPLSLKSCLEIAEATVLKRPYQDAPVSSLYLFHRKEDFAFEQAVGDSPRQRHHVRLWLAADADADAKNPPLWIGAATFDHGVGISHTTGQVTHHIAADVDTERDHVLSSLEQTGRLAEQYYVDDFHKQRDGHNGGGDPWRTDGRLGVGVIRP